ncbi:type II toxin-antitoxin system ParD family antitoxin [Membranicola marinus]|uniref:Type II toxin-antitoxin system ParD family antitoxin n=1 Tax=Membranihabitans marinus TaxID=1227546 RepID=A0A953HP33_9BACT|nr:type II toxin-antitoxin system ParD family antitoxin [Membranihabitans marinus]MBY5958654.1 type II toxin-antitoxin system ParD family antitoxin [Membranihabitans marinus]
MSVVRKSITFTEQQDAYIKSLVEKGGYTNESEFLRDLVRKDQEERRRLVELQDALVDGIESGPSDATIEGIWMETIQEYEAGK